MSKIENSRCHKSCDTHTATSASFQPGYETCLFEQ